MHANKLCTLLLLRREGEILLAMKKRGFGEGYWNGAGGKLEPGETIEQALVRETQEEIGVTPLRYEQCAEHDFAFPDGTPDIKVYAYFCDEWEGEPAESDEMAPRWFALRDIPYDQMWDDDQLWLPLVLKGKKLRCHFTFDNDNVMHDASLKIISGFKKHDGTDES